MNLNDIDFEELIENCIKNSHCGWSYEGPCYAFDTIREFLLARYPQALYSKIGELALEVAYTLYDLGYTPIGKMQVRMCIPYPTQIPED